MRALHPLFNPSSPWYYAFRWLFIILLGLAVYHQTFQFDFVFDDNEFIIRNFYIKDFNRMPELWDILPRTRMVGMYSFAFNYFINQLHPQGYHIFNFVVHLCAVGLVWGTAGLLFKVGGWGSAEGISVETVINKPTDKIKNKKRKSRPTMLVNEEAKQTSLAPPDWFRRELPWIIAVVFLVHPCQTQAVTYISQRFESMATVFYVGAIYCYLRARLSSLRIHKIMFVMLTAIACLLGILTKEVAVTIPLMIVAAEWILWCRDRDRVIESAQKMFREKTRLWVYLGVVIAGFFYSLLFMKLVRSGLSIFAQSISSESHDGDWMTPGNYFLTQMRVFLTFCRLLVFPIHQNLDYDYPMSTGFLHPPLTLVGIGLIGFFIFLIVKLCRSFPLIAFGLAWMLITFSINMVPRANVIFEHKLYLISFGFFLAVVTALSVVIRSRAVLAGLLGGIIVLLSVTSFHRNQVWENSVSLWEDVVQKSEKERGYANLGQAYLMSKRYAEALRALSKAIAIKPDDYKAYVNRGDVYHKLGLDDQSLKDLNQAIAINPQYFATYIGRARIHKARNNYPDAVADLTRAIDLQPNSQYAYMDRAVLWMAQRRDREALKDLQQALSIAPYDYGALVNRAGVYFYLDRYEAAIKDLNLAQTVDPTDAAVYKNKAQCLLKMDRVPEALNNFQTALRLDPNNAQTRAQYEKIRDGERIKKRKL